LKLCNLETLVLCVQFIPRLGAGREWQSGRHGFSGAVFQGFSTLETSRL
jgi:hypothetical protein